MYSQWNANNKMHSQTIASFKANSTDFNFNHHHPNELLKQIKNKNITTKNEENNFKSVVKKEE